eukprot:4169358-Alexandrium_andersonii.AAC.1
MSASLVGSEMCIRDREAMDHQVCLRHIDVQSARKTHEPLVAVQPGLQSRGANDPRRTLHQFPQAEQLLPSLEEDGPISPKPSQVPPGALDEK